MKTRKYVKCVEKEEKMMFCSVVRKMYFYYDEISKLKNGFSKITAMTERKNGKERKMYAENREKN